MIMKKSKLADVGKKIIFGSITSVYILPALIIYGALVLAPGFISLFYAFTDWDGVQRTFNFVGFSNFKALFIDKVFLLSIKNNFIYLFFNGAIQNTIALLYAIIINEKVKGFRIYRAIIFFPFILTPVAIAVAFYYFLHPAYGFFRQIFDFLNIDFNINFLSNPKIIVYVIGVIQIWLSMGVMVMVWLAGLQNLNKDLIEASMIDGANNFHVLTKVIIPLLTPSIIIVTVLTIVGNFKAFDLPWGLIQGGPGYASYFASIFIFKTAFDYFRFGYAMAASAVIFIVPLVLIVISLLIIRKRLQY